MTDEMIYEEIELEEVAIPMEDGTSLNCAVIDEFEIDDQAYIVLCPIDAQGELSEEEELYFRVSEDGEDRILTIIEDEEEMAWAVAAHNEIFDDEEDENDQ